MDNLHQGTGGRAGPGAHLEGQVGGNGDAGAQVDVAVLVAHEERGVALGLCPHRDTAAVLGPRPQPPCKKRTTRSLRPCLCRERLDRLTALFHSGLETNLFIKTKGMETTL